MRGLGDDEMDAEDPVTTMQDIVKTQREIIKTEYGNSDGVGRKYRNLPQGLIEATILTRYRGLGIVQGGASSIRQRS
jgi:hypothetical protein